jgi:hypothetical protein
MPAGFITLALVQSMKYSVCGEADGGFRNAPKTRSITNIKKEAGWWGAISLDLYSGLARLGSQLVTFYPDEARIFPRKSQDGFLPNLFQFAIVYQSSHHSTLCRLDTDNVAK